ncbi:2-hydroxymuconate tautomerase [Metasolibacillus sp.]|uniref:2-hydroxymuconate tautomerase n=1 Tax=Metasolibacillus sp. TaxID=2703680 RepID=UPI003434EB20|nr:4-oxalocrotonate tautomerase [Metasolibacillus sp.]MCT6939796.1 4-oxalocrotonate tautomerase [Metasolibacillus sp.]
MPIITIKMIEGRTDEQKRALVQEVTEAVSKTVNAPKENISIIIEEMSKNHYATAGVLQMDK